MGMRKRAFRAVEAEREGETERASTRWQRYLMIPEGRLRVWHGFIYSIQAEGIARRWLGCQS